MGNNEPICIAEEVPFEIPDSWEWVRLGSIINITSGKFLPASSMIENGTYPVYGGNGINGYHNEYIIDKPTLIIGRVGFYCGCIHLCKTKAWVTDNAFITSFSENNLDINFLKWLLISSNLGKNDNATAQPVVSAKKIYPLIVAIPPLDEQKRIVAKIEELLPLVKEYDVAYEKIEKLNNNFSEQLKKSILQEAVQGKLVPQNPNDEPASVLIERIREEKQKLIKEKKIKKDKNESYIFRRDNSHYEKIGNEERCIDDKIPFDIPDNWEWVRLGTITQINPRNQGDDDADAGFMPMTLLNAGYRNKHTFEIKKWKQIKSGFTHFSNNDIVIAKITPCFQNRKSAIIKDLPNNIGAGTTELHVIRDITNKLCLEYLLCLFKTEDFICKGVKTFTGTAGQQRIGKDFIEEYLIPLPPLEEQKRIVEKIKTLMPIIEIL